MADQNFLDIELIKKRAISGVVTFTLRTFFIQIFTYIAVFILTIILDDTTYGIYVFVSALINIFIYFSDVGLAAALIQKKDELTQNDLKTTFTIQQIIVGTLVLIGLLLSSKIASFFHLDHQGLTLIRVLIFSLFLSSLKTIPSILLERKLNFTRLVVPQIAENVVFYSLAVILSISGFGIASFTWAVLARGLIGLLFIYILSPWKPTLGFDFQITKKLTAFGIPFQVNSILALLKDDLLIVILGKMLTFAQIGYIGWSQKFSYLPLRLFMDSVNKVTFPAYSRLQEQKAQLGKAIEKSLFFVTYLVYPSALGIAAIAPMVIEIVPRYQKWEPALPLLYLFVINSLFSAISTTFTNALFATGRPKIVLNFMIFWTAATWALTIPLVIRFGYIGVGIASAVVAATSLATIYFVKKEMQVSVARSIFGPLLVSSVMFLVVRSILSIAPHNIFGLILTIIFGAIIYLTVSFAILKKHLTEDIMIIIKALLNR